MPVKDKKNLELIWRITRLMHSSKNLEEVLDRAIMEVMKSLKAEAGTIWLKERQGDYIFPFLARGPRVGGMKQMKLKIGEGVSGWVAQHGKSQIIADAQKDERWASRFDQKTGYVTRSMLCVPLTGSHSSLGCIQLLNKHDGELFSQEDLQLCEDLSGIVALAIENWGHLPELEDELEILIKLDNVSKIYGSGEVKVAALREVSANIYAGELLVILGTSGSGKSTLLNLLGGMDTPSSGEILIKGENIATANDATLTRYRCHEVGFVFQFYNLIPDLTAEENVALAAELADDPHPVRAVLEEVGLAHRLHNFPSQLSGGEQQRVAIARALVKKPALLLCDEPTGALDYGTGKQVLNLLTDIARQRRGTVIIVTHNAAIGAVANRVIKMRSGQIVEIIKNPHPESVESIEW